MRFRESGEVLHKKFLLKMKGKMYQICVRSITLYGSKTWCLREREMELLRRIKRAAIRALCGADRSKNTNNFMQIMNITVPIERMVRSCVRWYGLVLRREEGNILKEALSFEVIGREKEGNLKAT